MTVGSTRARTRGGAPSRLGTAATSLLVGAALVLSGSVASAAPAAAADNRAPTAPTGLRTELLTDPVVIDTTEPSLSWVVGDPDSDERQTAYRIVIAASAADVAAEQYVHDTGWEESTQSSSVEIPGIADVLDEDSLYYWQVQTKDREGVASPLSAPQPFNTAISWADTRGAWLQHTEDQTGDDANRMLEVPASLSAPGSLLDLSTGSGSGQAPAETPATLSPRPRASGPTTPSRPTSSRRTPSAWSSAARAARTTCGSSGRPESGPTPTRCAPTPAPPTRSSAAHRRRFRRTRGCA
ncbi:glycoside hydrolase family 78 protein [Leucobacter soli]|uniref:glycoside hydrolase family 78 protein n=1 Tax=Leucobacter soli TaxID=2812850 RepID=UPI00361D4394